MTTFDSRLKKLISLVPLPVSTVIGRRATGEEVAVTMAQLATDLGEIGGANNGSMSFSQVLSSATDEYLVMPACTVTAAYSVVDGTTDTGAEALTLANETGDMAGGVITIASGAVNGEVDTATPTTNNVFAIGEKLSCTSDGGNGQAINARVTILFEYI